MKKARLSCSDLTLSESNQMTNTLLSKSISEFTAVDDLVQACCKGCPVAQEKLYKTCSPRVYRLLVRMVGTRDAEDVLQQVFLQVFRYLDQFAGQSRFATWLHRIAVNESLQHLRKRERSQTSSLAFEPLDYQPNHEYVLDSKELMERAIQRLEPLLRSLFVLREIEELSYEEIAEILDIPPGTVASRLSRARRLIKQHLTDLGWEPTLALQQAPRYRWIPRHETTRKLFRPALEKQAELRTWTQSNAIGLVAN